MRILSALALSAALVSPLFAVQAMVLAHRGASGYLPEHSFPAKAMAHAQGADFVEQDLVLTKDGVPIVLHDIHLDTITDVAKKFPERKRTDGRYYAIDFTLAEIKQLDATVRFHPETGSPVYPNRFPLNGHVYQLHTFEEEIRFIQGLNHSTGRSVGLYTELKQPTFHRNEGQDLARIAVAILIRYGYADKKDGCWIQCFEQTTIRRLRDELGWKGNTMMILGGAKKGADGTDYNYLATLQGMKELVAPYADAIGPNIDRVVIWDKTGKLHVSSFTRDAHAAGLRVHWGVTRRDDLPANCPSYDALLEALYTTAGTEGGFTDFPDLNVQWLKDHRKR